MLSPLNIQKQRNTQVKVGMRRTSLHQLLEDFVLHYFLWKMCPGLVASGALTNIDFCHTFVCYVFLTHSSYLICSTVSNTSDFSPVEISLVTWCLLLLIFKAKNFPKKRPKGK